MCWLYIDQKLLSKFENNFSIPKLYFENATRLEKNIFFKQISKITKIIEDIYSFYGKAQLTLLF